MVDPIGEINYLGFLTKSKKKAKARTKSRMLTKGHVVVRLQHYIPK
jgi:hypothetical protein